MLRRCLEDKAPTYLRDYCIPVTAVSRRHLRSVNQNQLTVPRCRRITFGHRAFSVAGLTVWNSLPTEFLSVGFGDYAYLLRRHCSRAILVHLATWVCIHNSALYKFYFILIACGCAWLLCEWVVVIDWLVVYSVGAYHDGDFKVCSTKDQFVMALTPQRLDESNFDNPFRFSHCSINQIRTYVTRLDRSVINNLAIFFIYNIRINI